MIEEQCGDMLDSSSVVESVTIYGAWQTTLFGWITLLTINNCASINTYYSVFAILSDVGAFKC